MPYPKGNLFIDGPAGALECLEKRVEGCDRWAVISHAHPQHGGTMYFKVLHRVAKALEAAGFNTLRYHYRGVGHSAGSYDGGRGEADDLRAVLSFLRRERTEKPILHAGFSFGAWIGARAGCSDDRVDRLLHLGLAASFLELDFLSSCDKPTAVIQGDRDQYGEWTLVERLVSSMPRARLFRAEGADHFFEGRLDDLDRLLAEALPWLLAAK